MNRCNLSILTRLTLFASGIICASDALATMVDPKYCRGSQPFTVQAKIATSATPVYIGGVRYQINQTQMSPLYRYNWVPVPPPHLSERCWQSVDGLVIQLPVDGDAGQRLMFDISGRSGTAGVLNVSCGSFNGSDRGEKYVISTTQITGGSCRILRLELRNVTASSNVALDVQISEALE